MKIITQRIYDSDPAPGYRVLVDRLWPRGISKAEADLDDWWKDLAPSAPLRKWFGHDETKWTGFREKYLRELTCHKDAAGELLGKVPQDRLVLLYGAKSKNYNHALILKEYLARVCR